MRDGLSLSASGVITSLAGLVGWLLTARLLPRAEVGAAAAFVSGFLLVAAIADLGLAPALLRWLPRAGNRAPVLLRRSYAAVVAAALVSSALFLLLPAGTSVVAGIPAGAALFVLAATAWAVFQLQDAVLTGLGRAGWVPLENSAFSAARLGLLIALGPVFGVLGALLSWVLPTITGVLVVSALVVFTARGRHREPRADGVLPDRREVVRLIGPTYPATICVAVLYNVVPLIVNVRFGPEAGAVFFVVWMALNALDVSVTGFVNAMVVRLAGPAARSGAVLRAAAVRLAALFVPLILVAVLLAEWTLSLFGAEYAAAGGEVFRIALLGYLPRLVVVFAVGAELAAGRGLAVAALQGGGALGMLGFSLLVPVGALAPIGLGYAAVQLVLAGCAVAALRRRRAVSAVGEAS